MIDDQAHGIAKAELGGAANEAMSFVSVVVPVLNGAKTIRDCLVSVLNTDYPGRREVLVVDNGSTDGTAEVIKSFPVRYLREDRRGAAAARNLGIQLSEGEIIAFTDADCVVTTNWLRELGRGFENSQVGCVEGETVDYPPRTLIEGYAAMQRRFGHEARRHSPFAPFVATTNVAFRRSVFQRIGLFDPRFAEGGEDIDFSWRFLDESGLRLRFTPQAVVFHRHRSTVWSFFKQHLKYGRGMAMLQAKHPARIPWGWRRELRAWGRLGWSTWGATGSALGCVLRRGPSTEAWYPYFAFVRGFGVRLGVVWETVTRGH